MPTKSQSREEKGRRLAQRAMYADEVYWIGLAARLEKVSMHEFVSRRMRGYVRKVLADASIDPDAAWTNATRNGG